MKAISVRQPWSWLICHGFKDIENRTWRTEYRGPVLIRASKTYDDSIQGEHECLNGIDVPESQSFDFGGIVGVAEITDCISASSSPWFSGPFGFVIRNARPLPFMPVRGQLGFFEVDYKNGTP